MGLKLSYSFSDKRFSSHRFKDSGPSSLVIYFFFLYPGFFNGFLILVS